MFKSDVYSIFVLILVNSFKEKYIVQKKYTGRVLYQKNYVKMKLVG